MKRFFIGLCSGLLLVVILGMVFGFFDQDRVTERPPQIALLSPLTSAIIYADRLSVIGTTSASIRLQVEVWVDEKLISSQVDDFPAGEWAFDFVHGYTGEPTEANLRVLNPETGFIYQESVILLSQLSERPAGEVGRVVAPMIGADIGGDYVIVQGRVCGVQDESVTVQLIDDRQTVLDQHTITVHNRYQVDDMPFRVELAIGQHVGLVTIRIRFEQLGLEETIPINLVGVAG